MNDALRRPVVAVLVVLALAVGGCLAIDDVSDGGSSTDTTTAADGGATSPGETPTERETPDAPTVTVVAENGTVLGTVTVRVADTYAERYTGLSNTESLGPDEGMLFVHDREGEYAYVMRDMAFPIDIVFVDANRTITAIHHAETESRPYTRYRGRGKWVLEVPHGWTTDHGVEVGDRIRIDGTGDSA